MKKPIGYNTEYAIFTFVDGKLKVFLLTKEDGSLCLPGNIIENELTARDIVVNKINKHLKVTESDLFLRHIAVFDEPSRDYRGWIISNIFYVIINWEKLEYKDFFYDVEELSNYELAYDHQEIIENTIENVKKDLYETTIAKYFLNEEFTISELQSLLLSAREVPEIKRTHFFTKVKSMPFISPVLDENKKQKKKLRPGARRPAKLYCFDETDYISSIYFLGELWIKI